MKCRSLAGIAGHGADGQVEPILTMEIAAGVGAVERQL